MRGSALDPDRVHFTEAAIQAASSPVPLGLFRTGRHPVTSKTPPRLSRTEDKIPDAAPTATAHPVRPAVRRTGLFTRAPETVSGKPRRKWTTCCRRPGLRPLRAILPAAARLVRLEPPRVVAPWACVPGVSWVSGWAFSPGTIARDPAGAPAGTTSVSAIQAPAVGDPPVRNARRTTSQHRRAAIGSLPERELTAPGSFRPPRFPHIDASSRRSRRPGRREALRRCRSAQSK